MIHLPQSRRLALPFLVTSLGFALAVASPLKAAELGDNDWIYCLNQCPDLEEFCSTRGGHELAWCEYETCIGGTTGHPFPWKVVC